MVRGRLAVAAVAALGACNALLGLDAVAPEDPTACAADWGHPGVLSCTENSVALVTDTWRDVPNADCDDLGDSCEPPLLAAAGRLQTLVLWEDFTDGAVASSLVDGDQVPLQMGAEPWYELARGSSIVAVDTHHTGALVATRTASLALLQAASSISQTEFQSSYQCMLWRDSSDVAHYKLEITDDDVPPVDVAVDDVASPYVLHLSATATQVACTYPRAAPEVVEALTTGVPALPEPKTLFSVAYPGSSPDEAPYQLTTLALYSETAP